MKHTRFRTLAAFATVSVGSMVLFQVFIGLLFDRAEAHWGQDLAFSLPYLSVGLVACLVYLRARLAPLHRFVRHPEGADHPTRLALHALLARLPRAFFACNLVLFVVLPLAIEATKVAFGLPLPRPLDLGLQLALYAAFGFVASLQEISSTETLTVAVRENLAFNHVEGQLRDSSLRRRLFLVNLSSVLLSGLLAGMAALGFYREVVTYYTTLAADAVTAASTVSAQAVSENELKVVFQLGVLFLVVLAWTVSLTAMALAKVSRQLRTLESRVGEMADGSADLGKRAEVVFFDEVGLLTGRINAVMERMQRLVGAIVSTAGQVAGSTATVRAVSRDAEARLEAVGVARNTAESALGGQGQALGDTLDVAQDLEATSTTVQTAVAEQASAVSQSAAAMEQLASSAASVREMTQQADSLAGSLKETSEQGGRSVDAVRLSMGAIQEAALAVSGTVAAIKKTASQTNMLAMNAAIEAAHAGASGLGFAVVAGEVRVLAEDSSRGARTIADLMKTMNGRITEGDRLAREAGEAFSRIYSLILQTSEVMGTVARVMEEQRAGTDTLVNATQVLKEASLHIAAVTDRQANHAVNLNHSVQILVETGAALAQAQEVQSRTLVELASVVKTMATEADTSSQAANQLNEAVSGFVREG